jgi:hypothetical protein
MNFFLNKDLYLLRTKGFCFTQGNVASSFFSRFHGNHYGNLSPSTTAPFARLPFATEVAVINLDDPSETVTGVALLHGFTNLMTPGPSRWIG